MEIWKPVVNYKDYYSISNLGRVRREKPAQHTYKGKILKNNTDKDGYETICLTKNSVEKTFKIHLLVLRAFIGRRKKGFVTNHKNGNKKHNYLSNLKYTTLSQNQLHSYHILGNKAICGCKHWKAKFTETQIRKIRKMYSSKKFSQVKIAKMFKVNFRTISQIVLRTNWKHII